MAEFLDECLRLKNEKVNFVVITLVNIQGSAPQNLGAKAIITQKGLEFGTVGGGKVEKTAISYAQELFSREENISLVKWNLQKDIGMTCGGVVELLFEKISFESTFKVAVFGAGHVGQQLVKTLSNLNCSIIVVDSRDEWLEKITNKYNVTKIKAEHMAMEVDQLTDDYMIVSVTMGHAFDRPIFASALKRNFKFVGVIGSDQKAIVLRHELKTLDMISETDLAKLVCPIGEKFGSNDPAEIAISITAQLLKIRDHLK
jgi:xanthine dehydrogenase accessory factor